MNENNAKTCLPENSFHDYCFEIILHSKIPKGLLSSLFVLKDHVGSNTSLLEPKHLSCCSSDTLASFGVKFVLSVV